MPQTTSGATAKTKLENCNSSIFSEVAKIARNVVVSLESGNAAQACGNRIYKLHKFESLRFIAGYEPANSIERVAKSALLISMYRAEQISPGSSFLLCKMICGDSDIAIEGAYRIDRKILYSSISEILEDSASPFLNSLDSAGPDAVVSVKNSVTKDSIIKVSDSIEISCSGISEFGEKIELQSCRFLTVNGIIESVSEINKLLTECSESGEPLVIYARGWGYEVISTLLYNWRAGRLKVIPVSCSADPTSEYYFSDLPVCINGNVSIQGASSSSSELQVLSTVVLESGRISIKDKKASERARQHVSEIMKDSGKADIGKWASERARILSSRKIEFFIGEDAGTDSGIFSDRFNFAVRFYLEARKSGVVSIDGTFFPITSITVARSHLDHLQKDLKGCTAIVIDK